MYFARMWHLGCTRVEITEAPPYVFPRTHLRPVIGQPNAEILRHTPLQQVRRLTFTSPNLQTHMVTLRRNEVPGVNLGCPRPNIRAPSLTIGGC